MSDIKKDGVLKLITMLWSHVRPKRRFQLGLLVVLMLLASFGEILSIGTLLPFLGVVTDPQVLYSNQKAKSVLMALGLNSPEQLLFPVTVSFVVSAVLSGMLRLLLQWANTRLSYSAGADLSFDVYRKTLYQPYSVHISRNSSEVIAGITTKVGTVTSTFSDIMSVMTSVIILSGILIALVSIDPLVSLLSIGGFASLYAIIALLSHKRHGYYSERIAREQVTVIRSLQEGLGGIRDVLIDGTQMLYCNLFRQSDIQLRRAQASITFINTSPRYAIEALAMVLIALLAYFLASQGRVRYAIPVLGTIALGAQRLLPVLQSFYSSWSGIMGRQASLRDSLVLLEQKMPLFIDSASSKPITFSTNIKFKNISFRYASDNMRVIDDVSFVIKKGTRVGFIGPTGSGKSTMLDILMGLLKQDVGELMVDDVVINDENRRAWQSHISHVPQSIFLSDASVAENIAFGIAKKNIDYERVRIAARQAQIADTIEMWPQKYDTYVGERGVRLSGGQRQRIGIARALYKQSDVIIFDEATSALDTRTEVEVMRSIEELNDSLTILIIAHRLTTLKGCDMIIELEDGRVKKFGIYEEIIASHK